jgi:hypothetical protein
VKLAAIVLLVPSLAYATTFVFPQGSVRVTMDLSGLEDCNDGTMLVCMTSLQTQRAYLLALPPDDFAFVGRAYEVLLHRKGDTPGIAYYYSRLKGKTMSRDQVLDVFVASPEYKALHK